MQIISEKALDAYRGPGRCEWCKRFVRRREPHHTVVKRGCGGGSQIDHPLNLTALCATFAGGLNCHHEAEAGHILKDDLIALIAAREGCLQDQVRHAIHGIRALPRHSSQEAIDALLPPKSPPRSKKGPIARSE